MKAFILTAAAALALTPSLQAQDSISVVADTSYEDYHESPLSLPMGIGLRIPTYDRVNGLTVPWGPQLILADERIQLDALVRYRSNLGKWDPSLEGFLRPGTDNEITLFVGRGTFSNDSWIRSDLVNSLAVLGVGSDSRNYFRGDRASARFTRTLTTSALTLTPFVGGIFENDWSTGSIDPPKSPWSFFGRKGNLRMKRPNPRVQSGHIGAVIGGSGIHYVRGGVDANLDATVERALSTTLLPDCSGIGFDPACSFITGKYLQLTLDSRVQFPTFGTQTFSFVGHALWTASTLAPPQRYAYLGGSGTLATVNLLALGGDHLLYLAGDYKVPIDKIQLPSLGPPFVALHYAAGNAGEGMLPALIQNVGVGIGAAFIRADYSIDPARNRSPFSRKSAFTLGLELPL